MKIEELRAYWSKPRPPAPVEKLRTYKMGSALFVDVEFGEHGFPDGMTKIQYMKEMLNEKLLEMGWPKRFQVVFRDSGAFVVAIVDSENPGNRSWELMRGKRGLSLIYRLPVYGGRS